MPLFVFVFVFVEAAKIFVFPKHCFIGKKLGNPNFPFYLFLSLTFLLLGY